MMGRIRGGLCNPLRRIALIGLACSAAYSPVSAQTRLPASVEPGRIERRFPSPSAILRGDDPVGLSDLSHYEPHLCCLPPVVQANTDVARNDLPASDEPGRIEKRFEPPRTPLSAIEPTIPNVRPTPEDSGHIRFTLSGVVFDGTDQAADFLPLYSDRLGTEVSLSDIYALADSVTAKLKANGHKAKAIVPPQQVTGGIVHLAVVPEGAQ